MKFVWLFYYITVCAFCKYICEVLQYHLTGGRKKPSPVGEGGSRRLTDEELASHLFDYTSSTINGPPSPTGEGSFLIFFYHLTSFEPRNYEANPI